MIVANDLKHDTAGRLVSEKPAAGPARIYTYDKTGWLVSVGTSPDNLLKYQYDNHGRVTRIDGPEGLQLNYSYDDKGRLASVDNARKVRIEYRCSDDGKLSAAKDQLGNELEFAKIGPVKRPVATVAPKTDTLAQPPKYKFDATGRTTSESEGVKLPLEAASLNANAQSLGKDLPDPGFFDFGALLTFASPLIDAALNAQKAVEKAIGNVDIGALINRANQALDSADRSRRGAKALASGPDRYKMIQAASQCFETIGAAMNAARTSATPTPTAVSASSRSPASSGEDLIAVPAIDNVESASAILETSFTDRWQSSCSTTL